MLTSLGSAERTLSYFKIFMFDLQASDNRASPRLIPSGDHCLIVEFGQAIHPDLNEHACAFANQIRLASIQGIVDIVPMFAGVALHYRPERVICAGSEMPYDALCRQVQVQLASLSSGATPVTAKIVEVPVCYGGEFGPDFDDVARHAGMTRDALIEAHSGTVARVFMVGFAPGAPYLGLWDERFALPRRPSPRVLVPAGTISIANRQTTILPFDLPTGWHLLGRTPLKLFDKAADHPVLLAPGDQVRFVPITPAQFAKLAAEQKS